MNLLVSFLHLILNIAVIVFVAYAIVWLLNYFGISISGDMLKIGKIIVVLLIVIRVVVWLSVFLPA